MGRSEGTRPYVAGKGGLEFLPQVPDQLVYRARNLGSVQPEGIDAVGKRSSRPPNREEPGSAPPIAASWKRKSPESGRFRGRLQPRPEGPRCCSLLAARIPQPTLACDCACPDSLARAIRRLHHDLWDSASTHASSDHLAARRSLALQIRVRCNQHGLGLAQLPCDMRVRC